MTSPFQTGVVAIWKSASQLGRASSPAYPPSGSSPQMNSATLTRFFSAVCGAKVPPLMWMVVVRRGSFAMLKTASDPADLPMSSLR